MEQKNDTKEKTKLTMGEKLIDLRQRSGKHNCKFSGQELCNNLKKEYDFEIAKSTYFKIEKNADDNFNFGYKVLYYLAQFYGISMDYLCGLTEYKSPDMVKRKACELIGFDEDIIDALNFWSSKEALKDQKKIVSHLIKSISFDFVGKIIEFKRSDVFCRMITTITLAKYCKDNELNKCNTIENLPPKHRFILGNIINKMLEEYEIKPDYSKFILLNAFEDIINNIYIKTKPFLQEKFENENIENDEIKNQIESLYNQIYSNNNYKDEYEQIKKGEVNKDISFQKKLF